MSLSAGSAITRLSLKNSRNNLLDFPLPRGAVHVGINLGREYALVAEHFLDHPKVGPIFYKMRGK